MLKESSSAGEPARLGALARYRILDTAPEAAFDDLAILASRSLSTPFALVSLVDAHRLWCKAQVGLGLSELPRDTSFCQYAILQDDVFVVPDALADRRFASGPWVAGESKIRFYAGAPLVTAEGHRLGALAVLDGVPRQLDQAQRETLRALARQVMALLESRRAIYDLSCRYDQLQLLSEMSRKLLACSSSSETHDVIADFGSRVFPENSGRLFLRAGTTGNLVSAASWGEYPRRPASVYPDDCWALREGRPHVYVAGAGEPRCAHLESSPPASSICLPLEAQGETLGLLTLLGGSGGEEPSALSMSPGESKRSFAVSMAESVALAVGNLRLRERLESQSVRDSLTGLFNRHYLEESLERELAHASRNRLPLGLIMIDLDRFKSYNDRLGHPAGDELLRCIAALLKHGVRAGDIACRYGGDEFAVILPGAALEITRARAVELIESVKTLRAGSGETQRQTVTLSTGVAAFPEHGSTARGLLHAADIALYQAKALGRNRAVVAVIPSPAP